MAVLYPDVSRSVNKFNKNAIIRGYCVTDTKFVDKDGELYPLATYNLSNFIRVEPNTSYSITTSYDIGYVVAEYDENGTTPCINLLAPQKRLKPYTFITSPTTHYIRINIKTETNLDTYMVCKASEWPASYVAYVPDGYTITYNINGHGTQPQEVTATNIPNPLPVLTEDGWVFSGWFMDSSFINEAVPGAEISENTTLYAKWTEQVIDGYTITYNINGHGTQPPQEVNATNIPNPLPVLTEDGWVFSGWYYDSALTQSVLPGETILNDLTLYAKWVSESTPTYTIFFNENGGDPVQDLVQQTSIPNVLPTVYRNNYRFLGWYTDSTLKTPVVTGTTLNSNITLYAKWERIEIVGIPTIKASYSGSELEEFKVRGLVVPQTSVISKYKGKKIVFFGDSITYWTDCYPGTSGWPGWPSELGNSYYLKNFVTLTREDLGVLTVNQGIAGEQSASCSNRIRNYNFNNVDVLVIMTGTNDFNNNVNPNTYGTNITKALTSIFTNYPKLKVVCITPPPAYNMGTKTYTIKDYGDKLEEVCTSFNLPVLRIDKYLPFNSLNYKEFYIEGASTSKPRGLHPNNDGHRILANLFIAFINNNF